MTSLDIFLLCSGIHLGFQVVTTAVVYPGLADDDGEDFRARESRHIARMVPVVVGVYLPLVAAAAAVPVTASESSSGALGLASLMPVVVVSLLIALTLFGTYPRHLRLASGWDPDRFDALRRADQARLALAIILVMLAIGLVVVDRA